MACRPTGAAETQSVCVFCSFRAYSSHAAAPFKICFSVSSKKIFEKKLPKRLRVQKIGVPLHPQSRNNDRLLIDRKRSLKRFT